MARKPLDLYKRLIATQITEETKSKIMILPKEFSKFSFAGQSLSDHLTGFLTFVSQLFACLDNRHKTDSQDAIVAVDVLDYFASVSKWWTVTREDPGFIIRPASRDPRNFLKSVSQINLSGPTLTRINAAATKLDNFLSEHEIGTLSDRNALCDNLISVWALLSAFVCKSQARSTTVESDFEVAYDISRILLFYTPAEDFRALTAIRRIARQPRLQQIASVSFSPGFEKQLESSLAARIEARYSPPVKWRLSSTFRFLLTNTLRLLIQIEAAKAGLSRVDDVDYEQFTIKALKLIELVGISSDLFRDETRIIALLKRLPRENSLIERLDLLTKKIENLITESQSRDFLLQYAKLVPRLVSLLLFLAAAKELSNALLQDLDIKKGLLLLETLLYIV